MKLNKKIDFQNVEELSRQLKAGRAFRERFSLEIPVNDCANGIYAAFKQEVEYWGGMFTLDPDTKAHIFDAAQWLSNPQGSPGLLLCGLYGNGKTTLAKAIQRFIGWITEEVLGYSSRKRIRFMKAKEICRLAKANPQEYEKLFSEELLIIDELGEEAKEIMTYGSIETPMVDLISERYDSRLFTIITTNLQTNEIKDKYGARIYDRFSEMLTSIVFENDSYRLKKRHLN
ncbi:MAG: AAA family ATPase [Lachnospiraceae bacterium]|nr:AAA family ATPase [Lachnospiraceae bacterium]